MQSVRSLALAALSCALLASPAIAGPAAVRVAHADLDLAKPAGVQALQRRLDAAVRLVCRSNGEDIRSRMEGARCIRHGRVDAGAAMGRVVSRAQTVRLASMR